MSVLGIDVGNLYCIIAQAKRGGIDVLLNDESKRQNLNAVSFSGNERYLSDAAAPHLMSNYKNTVVQIKRLIGRRFDDPMVKRDLEHFLPFKVVPVDDGAACGIEVSYQDKTQVMPPQAILGMLLARMRDIANKSNPGATAADIVLSVPGYFTNAQRSAVLNAVTIAGVNCLKLINEGTAVALGYGFFRAAKQPFDDSKATNVLFVDAGNSHTTATVVCYRNKSATVVASVSDEEAGGREIDLALAKHLAAAFAEANGGTDCWASRKARMKLFAVAEKAKKTLSPYGVKVAQVHSEFLHMEMDLHTKVEDSTFETLCEPVAARIEAVVTRALAEAKLEAKDLETCEIVGGAVRARPIKRAIARALGFPMDEAKGHGLGTGLNQDEAVARGCALQCAMLSPLFRVKEFAIADCVPRAIRLSWEADPEAKPTPTAAASAAASSGEASSEDSTTVLMFAKGDPMPVSRRITFYRRKPFNITATYDDESLDAASRAIGVFTVGGFPEGVATPELDEDGNVPPAPKVRVDFGLTFNGTLEVEQAVVLQEKKEEPAPTPEPTPEPAPEAEAAPAAEGTDAAKPEGEADTEAPKPEGEADTEAPKAEAPKEEAKPAEEKEAAPAADDKPKKKRFRKVLLEVAESAVPGKLPSDTLAAARAAEEAMQAADTIIRRTQALRNEIEEYVYSMRDRMDGSLAGFATEEESSALKAELLDAEDWVCYGEGFEADLATLDARMAKLRSLGGPIADRQWEAEHRGPAASELMASVERFQDVVRSTDERYEHLSDEDRDRLRSAIRTAEEWLRDLQDKQAAAPPVRDPVLKTADIQSKQRWLVAECQPIADKPKPPPPAPEVPAPAADANAEAKAAADAKAAEEAKAAATDAAEQAAAKADDSAEATPDAEAEATPDAAEEAPAAVDA